jgi:hypothetical protein
LNLHQARNWFQSLLSKGQLPLYNTMTKEQKGGGDGAKFCPCVDDFYVRASGRSLLGGYLPEI